VVDITEDPLLASEYDLRIPVLCNERGQVLAEGPLSWKQVYLAVRKA
jgi:hypothetical protein